MHPSHTETPCTATHAILWYGGNTLIHVVWGGKYFWYGDQSLGIFCMWGQILAIFVCESQT